MAYRFQPTGVPRSPYWQPAAGGSLLSPDLWQGDWPEPDDPAKDFENDREDIRRRQAVARRAAARSNELPDELVREYSDLDNDSRNFLKHGPRSAAERLAYAQQVNPLAHLDAEPAVQDVQRRFQESRELDRAQHFVGPDGRVYVRNEDTQEQLGARIRRGYEQIIGGFATSTLDQSLGAIPEATRSKRADVELYNPPTLPEQEERERFLAEYHVNPTAWQSGDRADEETQRAFQEAGYLWDAIFPWAYVGPDGVVYYKNELTRQDPFTKYHNARDWWETQQYLRTLPEPTAGELLWRAMAAGGMLPGGRQVSFKGASGKFVPPGGMEARAQIRARLADIPRQAALHGWAQAPSPTPTQPAYRPPVPTERYWGGSRGNKRTQDQIERITQAQVRSQGHTREAGGIADDGSSSRELYYPNRAAIMAWLLWKEKIDGRLGSTKFDRTMMDPNRSNPKKRRYHFGTMTKDLRTGKATEDELNRLLRQFLLTGESNFGFLKDD